VETPNNHNQLLIFERLSAFHLYTAYGLEMACSIYPHQRDFIMTHSSKSLDEVRKECYRNLGKSDALL
jgi:hypothetical protein